MALFKAKEKELAAPDMTRLPRHIAIIMDGNGRWAKKRGLPRTAGHAAGAETFRTIATYCKEIGLDYLTVYAFSTENWSRPREEVDALMALFDRYLDTLLSDFESYRANFVFLGDKTPLPEGLRAKMEDIERRSRELGSDFTLNLAINYGGRDEIVHAVNSLLSEGKREITADELASRLYTAASPDPDLIVRTAGEQRLSNFLLWQSSYAELYFTDRLWPDMDAEDVDRAVSAFLGRTRRFGGVK